METKTKRLHIAMTYTYVGNTGIDIPVDLLKGKTEEEQYDIAYAYAKNHIDDIPVAANAEYIAYSDDFDRVDIDFEDGVLEMTNNDSAVITDEMYEELKAAVWDNGVEAIDDLFGYESNPEEDKDVVESRMDMVLDQMPPEEFMDFYNKYCDKEVEQELE